MGARLWSIRCKYQSSRPTDDTDEGGIVMNTCVKYLYRDASNYKQRHNVVLDGEIAESPSIRASVVNLCSDLQAR